MIAVVLNVPGMLFATACSKPRKISSSTIHLSIHTAYSVHIEQNLATTVCPKDGWQDLGLPQCFHPGGILPEKIYYIYRKESFDFPCQVPEACWFNNLEQSTDCDRAVQETILNAKVPSRHAKKKIHLASNEESFSLSLRGNS